MIIITACSAGAAAIHSPMVSSDLDERLATAMNAMTIRTSIDPQSVWEVSIPARRFPIPFVVSSYTGFDLALYAFDADGCAE